MYVARYVTLTPCRCCLLSIPAQQKQPQNLPFISHLSAELVKWLSVFAWGSGLFLPFRWFAVRWRSWTLRPPNSLSPLLLLLLCDVYFPLPLSSSSHPLTATVFAGWLIILPKPGWDWRKREAVQSGQEQCEDREGCTVMSVLLLLWCRFECTATRPHDSTVLTELQYVHSALRQKPQVIIHPV